jgi:hypothetical protein
MKNSLLKFPVFYLLMLCSLNSFAQDPGTENTSGNGNLESTDQVAPINHWIIPMFVLGSLLSIYLIRKKIPQVKNRTNT